MQEMRRQPEIRYVDSKVASLYQLSNFWVLFRTTCGRITVPQRCPQLHLWKL